MPIAMITMIHCLIVLQSQPYDSSIKPVECKVRYMLFGEGYHNYHHAFPW